MYYYATVIHFCHILYSKVVHLSIRILLLLLLENCRKTLAHYESSPYLLLKKLVNVFSTWQLLSNFCFLISVCVKLTYNDSNLIAFYFVICWTDKLTFLFH